MAIDRGLREGARYTDDGPSRLSARSGGPTLIRNFIVILAVLLPVAGAVPAGEIILQDPSAPQIKASALDQPELYAVLLDGGEIITEDGTPVLLEAFIDTGASSYVISMLSATGLYGVPSLGLTSEDYIGAWTETGIAGEELGLVSREFGVGVINVVPGTAGQVDTGAYLDSGMHNLWVRAEEGVGEYIYGMADPINVIGMPTIRQYVMTIDPAPMADLSRLETRLLPPGSPDIPTTNLTFSVAMEDFMPDAPPGETPPSYSENPVVQGVSLAHGGQDSTAPGQWLLDTGASGSFLSFARAQEVGLIPSSYTSLEDYLPDHTGLTSEVGGIGGTAVVPMLELNELRIATEEGHDVVWKNVMVHVLDVAGLDGVLGMNLFVPAVTVDPDDPLGSLFDISPGYFDSIVFDATDPNDAELRVYISLAPQAVAGDFNGDNEIDAADIDLLQAAIASGSGDESMDLTGDGEIDRDDLDELIRNVLGTEYGDITLDQRVDAADLSVLAARWNESGVDGWAQGDMTGDGGVDGADLSLLAGAWGWTPPASAVPEPAAIGLILAGGAVLLLRRPRRSTPR